MKAPLESGRGLLLLGTAGAGPGGFDLARRLEPFLSRKLRNFLGNSFMMEVYGGGESEGELGDEGRALRRV